MNENKAVKPVLIFSLIAILIVGLYMARFLSESAPTYDGTRTDVKALETDSSAYETEDADGVAAVMVDENNEKTAASNVVYSVVFNYRGYDTLGESFILIGAIAGTTAILRRKEREETSGEKEDHSSPTENARFGWEKNTDEVTSVSESAAAGEEPLGGVESTAGKPAHTYHKKPVIVRSGSDNLLPLGLIYGGYIILHGAMSPGGGFQGGVLAASAVMLVYLAYGLSGIRKAFHTHFLHTSEMAVEIFYVLIAMTGIFAGLRFCFNFVFPVGQEESAMLMNDAVGYHVMAGISCLLLLMLGTLEREDMKNDRKKKYHPAKEAEK